MSYWQRLSSLSFPWDSGVPFLSVVFGGGVLAVFFCSHFSRRRSASSAEPLSCRFGPRSWPVSGGRAGPAVSPPTRTTRTRSALWRRPWPPCACGASRIQSGLSWGLVSGLRRRALRSLRPANSRFSPPDSLGLSVSVLQSMAVSRWEGGVGEARAASRGCDPRAGAAGCTGGARVEFAPLVVGGGWGRGRSVGAPRSSRAWAAACLLLSSSEVRVLPLPSPPFLLRRSRPGRRVRVLWVRRAAHIHRSEGAAGGPGPTRTRDSTRGGEILGPNDKTHRRRAPQDSAGPKGRGWEEKLLGITVTTAHVVTREDEKHEKEELKNKQKIRSLSGRK